MTNSFKGSWGNTEKTLGVSDGSEPMEAPYVKPRKRLSILKILSLASLVQDLIANVDEAAEDGQFSDNEIVEIIDQVNGAADIIGIDLPVEELATTLSEIGDCLQTLLARGGKIAKELQD